MPYNPPVEAFLHANRDWGGELQDHLLKQATLKQQSMLDDIKRANMESMIRDRDENTRVMGLYRQGLIDDRKEKENQRRLGTFAPGEISDPKSVEWLKQNFPQTVKEEQVPTGSAPDYNQMFQAETAGQAPAPQGTRSRAVFMGTPAYQQQEAQKQRIRETISKIEAGTMTPMQGMTELMEFSKDPASTFERYITSKAANPQNQQENETYIVGPTGKIELAKDPVTGQPLSSKAKTVHLSYPPQPTAAVQPDIVTIEPGDSPDGKKHTYRVPKGSTTITPDMEFKVSGMPAPPPGPPPATPKGGGDISLPAPSSGRGVLPVAITRNTPQVKAGPAGWYSDKAVADMGKAKYSPASKQVFVDSITDKAVQADINQIRNDPKLNKLPLEKIKPGIVGDPEHVQKVIQALTILSGGQ